MSTALYEDGIDVGWPVREHLLTRDRPSYERHMTPWKGPHRTPLRTVHAGAQLLAEDRQNGVGGGRGGGHGEVEEGDEVVLVLSYDQPVAAAACVLASFLRPSSNAAVCNICSALFSSFLK